MARSKERKERLSLGRGADAPLNSPFSGLVDLRDSLPEGDAPLVPEDAVASAAPIFRAQVIVRKERKGRGGKPVTAIEGVQLTGPALSEFARVLRQQLGTRAQVEDGRIVVGGDCGERLADWLRARGAKRVVVC